MSRHLAGQTKGVAGVVGEADHLVALVVVAQHQEPLAEGGLGRPDAPVHLLVGQAQVLLWQRLPLTDLLFLDLRQQRDERVHRMRPCESFRKVLMLKRPNSTAGREKLGPKPIIPRHVPRGSRSDHRF